jgi:hypothetical protein
MHAVWAANSFRTPATWASLGTLCSAQLKRQSPAGVARLRRDAANMLPIAGRAVLVGGQALPQPGHIGLKRGDPRLLTPGPDVGLDTECRRCDGHEHDDASQEPSSAPWISRASSPRAVHSMPRDTSRLCTPARLRNPRVDPDAPSLRLTHALTLRGKPADKVAAAANLVNLANSDQDP